MYLRVPTITTNRLLGMTHPEELIAPYLTTNETVEWLGSNRRTLIQRLGTFVVGVLFFLFVFFAFLSLVNAKLIVIPLSIMTTLLGRALYDGLKVESSLYAITNQRILIITNLLNNQVEIILPETISQVETERVKNNRGNLYYAYDSYWKNGAWCYNQIGFKRVNNISQACEALEKLYKLGLVSRAELQQKLMSQICVEKEYAAYTWPVLYQAVEPRILANEELLWVDEYHKVGDSTIFSYFYRTASTEKHKTLQNSIYFITTKRAVILVDNKIQRGFCPQHINQLKLEKINDDIGTIYFQQEYHSGSESPCFIDIGFVNIRDMDYVALLLEWLKTQRLGN